LHKSTCGGEGRGRKREDRKENGGGKDLNWEE